MILLCISNINLPHFICDFIYAELFVSIFLSFKAGIANAFCSLKMINPLSPSDALNHHFTMKLVYQYIAIFFTFSPTSSHRRPLQVENCGSKSRIAAAILGL